MSEDMTPESAREQVGGEAARRIKEVHHLSMLTQDMGNLSARSPMKRACVVLFHGHLEGFVKNSSRTLLQFMEHNKIIPLHLSEGWLKKQRFDCSVLLDVVHFLDMDKGLFQTKQVQLGEIKKLRDKIAHGADISEAVQLKDSDIREMGEIVSEVIKDFENEILKIVDNH